MTLRLPDETKHARIVNVVVGPVGYFQLRHVPSDWVIVTVGHGPANAARLRQAARRRGYAVDERVEVEDWNSTIAGMMKS